MVVWCAEKICSDFSWEKYQKVYNKRHLIDATTEATLIIFYNSKKAYAVLLESLLHNEKLR